MKLKVAVFCCLLTLTAAATRGEDSMNEEQYRRKLERIDEVLNRKREEGIKSAFRFCDRLAQKDNMKSMYKDGRLDVYEVKCELYEQLKSCTQTGTPDEIWTCITNKCGDPIYWCKDVETSQNKIKCVFKNLIASANCERLRPICSLFPIEKVLGHDGQPVCKPVTDK